MNYLLDTNILLRLSETGSPFHPICRQAISSLLAQGDFLFICAQNIIEYWAVATRPIAANGLGFDPVQAENELPDFEKWAHLLLEPPGVGARWRQLVQRHGVRGKQAHDTRLIPFMDGHGLSQLLTLNTPDFSRFTHISCLSPEKISSPARQ
ncbi:MAG: twitching motility protein PilT [Verrucomicrobiales bacterium]|nr:twitching motility protein PilT [Verrucomicrobiales bacterium]